MTRYISVGHDKAPGLPAFLLGTTLLCMSAAAASRPMTTQEIATYLPMVSGTTYQLSAADTAMIKSALSVYGPQLQASLKAAAAAEGKALPPKPVPATTGLTDINIINNFHAADGGSTFTASGLSSVAGGTVTTTIEVQLIDTLTKTILDSAVGTQMGQGTNFQVALTASAPAGHPVMATALITYVPADSPDVVKSYVVTSSQNASPTTACMTAPNYCTMTDSVCNGGHSTSCTNNLTVRPPISICYTRGSAQSCDYWYSQPNHPTIYFFPVAGNAVFNSPVYSPLTGSLTATMQNPIVGGGCQITTQVTTNQVTPSQWRLSGDSIIWNLNPLAIADPNDCFTNYSDWIITNFYFSGSVQLQETLPSGGHKYGNFSFTSDSTQIGQPGIYVIPILDIQQGCFASGTRIAVKDGERNIETFTAEGGEYVLGKGEALKRVVGSSSGTERYPMKRVKAGEFSVLATRKHPFATERGLIPADGLRKGDMLLTRRGKRPLESITDESFSGKVYNLRVGSKQGAAKGENLLYANGFLVGDALTQHHYEVEELKRRASDPAYLKSRIPEKWRKDYELYLKSEQASKSRRKGH